MGCGAAGDGAARAAAVGGRAAVLAGGPPGQPAQVGDGRGQRHHGRLGRGDGGQGVRRSLQPVDGLCVGPPHLSELPLHCAGHGQEGGRVARGRRASGRHRAALELPVATGPTGPRHGRGRGRSAGCQRRRTQPVRQAAGRGAVKLRRADRRGMGRPRIQHAPSCGHRARRHRGGAARGGVQVAAQPGGAPGRAAALDGAGGRRAAGAGGARHARPCLCGRQTVMQGRAGWDAASFQRNARQACLMLN
mmetsp:Transcript_14539/g.36788  ORF Transcript_14539/g.36788 Transcript_14539/m.36788 type:complete len:248 (-) Transcript_14539:42-785(-)